MVESENRAIRHANVKKNLLKLKASKLQIRIDLTTLDMTIGFLYKESSLRTRKAINNIDKLFKSLDMTIYKETEQELLNRIWIIKNTLDARIKEGLVNDDIIVQYCKDREDCDAYKRSLLDILIPKNKKITYEESKYLLKQVDDRLKFGYAITLKHAIDELMDLLDETDPRTYKAIEDDLQHIATSIINIKRRTNSIDSNQSFSLQEETLTAVVSDALTRLKNRSRIFLTGIQRLNTFLAPGYQGGKLYTYLACPGGGKSQILLKSALDIRKYNKDVECKNPDNRPAVLMITMENTIDETVERIFNMVGPNDDIRNYTPKQVERILKKEGGLELTDKDGIDIIIKYFPNRSIDTGDLYALIQDLDDEGVEVIALVLDYLKRIKPAERADTEKEELKNITNELRDLAIWFDIPVITAQQLNRSAASVIDAAIQANKADVTRLVGRDGIAGAWEIIENTDVLIIINREKKLNTGEVYLTFKLLKRRYGSMDDDELLRELTYFNHPYVKGSGIKLVDDLELDESVSLTSLASSFGPAPGDMEETERGQKNAVERKREKKKLPDSGEFGFTIDYEPFDFSKSTY